MRCFSAIALLMAPSIFLVAQDFPESNPRRLPQSSVAESPRQAMAQPLSTGQIIHGAGLIFSGTVLSVEHLSTGPNSPQGITRICFRVQSAIRGARSGQIIQIREWGGLWSAGERYQPGETVMLFLYPSSKLGLTSLVGGAAGRFRVNQSGRVQISNEHTFRSSSTFQQPSIRVKDFAAAIRRAARE